MMSRLRVLMIGPGSPDENNTGLGVAAERIAIALQDKVDLTVIQPANAHSLVSRSKKHELIEIADEPIFGESAIEYELASIDLDPSISPYLYPYPYPYNVSNTESTASEPNGDTLQETVKLFSNKVVDTASKYDFDLIYAHDWPSFKAATELQAKSGVPLFAHAHSLDVDRMSEGHRSWIFDLEKETFEAADEVITVSQFSAKLIEKQYQISSKKITAIYNGKPDLSPPTLKRKFPEKLVLFAGRLTAQKGPDLFVEMAHNTLKKRDDVRFVVAGDGPMREDLIEQVAQYQNGDKLLFTGFLQGTDLGELMYQADIFCMPSRSEPFGLVAIEATVAGTPVILTEDSGAKEVLPSSPSIFGNDVIELEKTVAKLLDDPSTSKDIVKHNQHSIKNLSWENTASMLVERFLSTRAS